MIIDPVYGNHSMILPLFPLNTVLFPGAPLRLHIFEDRYKLMISECIQSESLFGVVLIRQGKEAHAGMAVPHMVGCTARISHMQPLDNGRMNIQVVGESRFRIISTSQDLPYLTGETESFPLESQPSKPLQEYHQRLLPLLQRYASKLSEASNIEFSIDQFPSSYVDLIWTAGFFLQANNTEKQHLLESPSLEVAFQSLINAYRRETALLDVLLDKRSVNNQGKFSRN